MKTYELADAVETREDFVRFARTLAEEYARDGRGWENRDLKAFLDAAASWIEDADGYYRGRGETLPSPPGWRLFAHALQAAKVYE